MTLFDYLKDNTILRREHINREYYNELMEYIEGNEDPVEYLSVIKRIPGTWWKMCKFNDIRSGLSAYIKTHMANCNDFRYNNPDFKEAGLTFEISGKLSEDYPQSVSNKFFILEHTDRRTFDAQSDRELSPELESMETYIRKYLRGFPIGLIKLLDLRNIKQCLYIVDCILKHSTITDLDLKRLFPYLPVVCVPDEIKQYAKFLRYCYQYNLLSDLDVEFLQCTEDKLDNLLVRYVYQLSGKEIYTGYELFKEYSELVCNASDKLLSRMSGLDAKYVVAERILHKIKHNNLDIDTGDYKLLCESVHDKRRVFN